MIARADVGMAMGGVGSDVAVETADVILMTDAPSKVADAIRMGKRTRSIVWQNVGLSLGFALVLGFSMGLAITLVTVGTLAALSVKHASKRFKRFGEFARKAPYVSSIVLIVIGLLVAIQGLRHLM